MGRSKKTNRSMRELKWFSAESRRRELTSYEMERYRSLMREVFG